MPVEQIWVICAGAAATRLVDVTRSVNAEWTNKTVGFVSFMSIPKVPDLAVHVNIPATSVTSFVDTENLRQRRHPGRAGSALACAVVTSVYAGGGVLAGRSGPGRSRAPAVTAPAANMPAVHQNAVS